MSNTSAVPAWRLLAEEARIRGFRNALSFRRWCRRAGVPITKTGRMETVSPAAVDAAVIGTPAVANELETAADAAVANLFHRKAG